MNTLINLFIVFVKWSLRQALIGQDAKSGKFSYYITPENLTELVELVNEEMDVASSTYQDELDTIISEIGGVERGLGNLYNAIENGNIEFNLLKPRLQELRAQHDLLLARKSELEVLMSQRKDWEFCLLYDTMGGTRLELVTSCV
jgi:hypothetical protein